MNHLTRIGSAVAAAAVTLGLAAPAHAQTTTTATGHASDTARRVCTNAVDVRLTALDDRQRQLAQAQHLTDADRSALNTNVSDTRSRLVELKAKIANDSDRTTFKADCEAVFTQNRVFALVVPRTRLVNVADTEVWAAGRLNDAATKLQAAVDKAKSNGKDVTKAQSDLDAMKAKTASGQASASGVPSSILSFTPADWNANHDLLTPTRTADKSAHDNLKAARGLATQVINDLRA